MWGALCKNTNLSSEFFRKYIFDQKKERLITWDDLCVNENMSLEFFEKCMDHNMIYWGNIFQNSNIELSFFEKYFDRCGEKEFNSLFQNTFKSYHSKNKIISWLRKNPQYPFDKMLEKYI